MSWAVILTVACSLIVAFGVITSLIGRLIGDRITNAIDRFRIEVVSSLDLRLTHVEDKLEEIRRK